MAIFCEAGQGLGGVEGKGGGTWTDGGIGGMVCVVGMREGQQGAGHSGLFLFHPRAGGQSLDTEDGERGSRSQKRGREEMEMEVGVLVRRQHGLGDEEKEKEKGWRKEMSS